MGKRRLFTIDYGEGSAQASPCGFFVSSRFPKLGTENILWVHFQKTLSPLQAHRVRYSITHGQCLFFGNLVSQVFQVSQIFPKFSKYFPSFPSFPKFEKFEKSGKFNLKNNNL